MSLDIIMGFIAGVGLYTGVRTILIGNKKLGVLELILTFFPPILTSLLCAKKSSFVFGGTDWEFLVQCVTVDKIPETWLILILYMCLIGLTIYNIIKIRKSRK